MRTLLLLLALAPYADARALPIVYQHRRDGSGRMHPTRAEEQEIRATLERVVGREALRGGFYAEVVWEPGADAWFHAWVSDARPPHALSDRDWWDRHAMKRPADADTTFDVTCLHPHGGCGTGVDRRVYPQ